ncbi:tellurite resistance TerB family protein [Dokdonella immobilis]|nr:TerB N-terminal domain-containing protein [Dokdonella immobilis]
MVPRPIWIVVAVLGGGWLLYILLAPLFRGSAPKKPELTLAQLTGGSIREPTQAQRLRAQEIAQRAKDARTKANLSPQVPDPAAPWNIEPAPPVPMPDFPSRPAAPASSDDLYEARLASRGGPATPVPSRAIPRPKPAQAVPGRWIVPTQVIKFRDFGIPGGLFYIGHELESPSGGVDPCLINIRLNVAKFGDYTQRQMDYWPSYSRISADARCAYLKWLIQGRKAPDCDIGFVFLFFYGLERRVLFDGARGIDISADLPAIATELRRLLGLYAEKSGSFRSYATGLLDWVELSSLSDRLYDGPIPTFERSYEVPLHLRVALGQASRDRVPVPAELALRWARACPVVRLRTPATRCPDVFDRLFMQVYGRQHGAGMVLPKNRTKLKLVYRPASSAFRNLGILTQDFGGIPDVTVLQGPIQALQEIANTSCEALAAYSRLVGRDAANVDGIEGLLCLPTSLWPTSVCRRIERLVESLGEGMQTLRIDDALRQIDPNAIGKVSKETANGVARALREFGIGMEPNVLEGAKAPKPGDAVVLFKFDGSESSTVSHDGYQVAMLTLQLASAVARADGEFDAEEIAHLEQEIEHWTHLTPAHQTRLRAHVQWLVASRVTLASLKKKLEPLDTEARETLVDFMVALVHADGVIEPKEIAFLEKVYKALGIDPTRLSSDVHAGGTSPSTPASAPGEGLRLDAGRIAALQRDTEKVSALLANIFVEEEPVSVPRPEVEDDPPEGAAGEEVMGLDRVHSEFVRLLLSRPQWTRSELEDAAADMDLMLDGALEVVNEAAFDAHDEALIEGEDPMEVNLNIKETLEA